MTAIAINGATGRMGRSITSLLVDDSRFQLKCAFTHQNSAELGRDVGLIAGTHELGIAVSSVSQDALKEVQIVIDFSVPSATIELLDSCTRHGVGLVSGTTGLNEQQRNLITQASNEIPILIAPNMSVGVNVLFRLIDQAVRMLDSNVDVEIHETHHRNKRDAPSGTAIRMGEILASASGQELADLSSNERVGFRDANDSKQIVFHSARGGDVVGEHTVTFFGRGERIEVTHRASSRSNFAAGALRAAAFIAQKIDHGAVGMYSMHEVLGMS